MRIVHCARAPVGGIFRHVRDLARAQSRAGHEVGVVFDATTGSPMAEEDLTELGNELSLGVHRLPMARTPGLGDLMVMSRLYRTLHSLKPEILHGHGAKGGAYARLVGSLLRLGKSGPRRIYTPHGGSLHYDQHSLSGRLYLTLERLQENLTDGFVFVSDYELSAYASKVRFPRPRFARIPNGLSERDFEPVTLCEDARDFLFIGELRYLKGTDVFLNAMAQLRAKGTPATACIVGDGPDREAFEAQTRTLDLTGSVTFLGAKPARDAFALARTVVVPSRAESLPYVVLEALAAGKPLITTRTGGIPEVYGSLCTQLAEPGDIDGLAYFLQLAVQSPEMVQNVTNTIRISLSKFFSEKNMSDSIVKLYNNTMMDDAASQYTTSQIKKIWAAHQNGISATYSHQETMNS